MSSPAHYREVQHFNPWLILLPTALVALLLGLGFREIAVGISPWQLAMIVSIAAAPALLMLVKIVTEVRLDGVYVRLFPFPFRHIPFDQIASAEVVQYRPLVDYGGWGLRFGRHATAYNARGNRGVMLRMRAGRNVLLGSQDPELLFRALQLVSPVTTH